SNEHINCKEARAFLESARILRELFDPLPLAVRWCVDNLSALGSLRRGRSRSFALNEIVTLAREMLPSWLRAEFCFVPSKLNPADGPSRGRAPSHGELNRARLFAREADN